MEDLLPASQGGLSPAPMLVMAALPLSRGVGCAAYPVTRLSVQACMLVTAAQVVSTGTAGDRFRGVNPCQCVLCFLVGALASAAQHCF